MSLTNIIADADGRARRVEYFADESGFHAKVQTNEVGTKSENSADVEVLASPPTREQYVYQQTPVAQAPIVRAPVVQKNVAAVSSPTVARVQPSYAQYGYNSLYGYYPGYGYNSQYNYASPAYGYTGYGSGYGSGYGLGLGTGYGSAYGSAYGGYGAGAGYGNSAYGSGLYSSYNNHLPSSYYKSVQSVSGVQPSSYSSGGLVGRYAVSNPVVGAVGSTGSSYRTVGVPVGVGYQTGVVNPQRVAYSSSSSVPVGSSNYIVLKKRESEANAEAKTDAKNDVNKS